MVRWLKREFRGHSLFLSVCKTSKWSKSIQVSFAFQFLSISILQSENTHIAFPQSKRRVTCSRNVSLSRVRPRSFHWTVMCFINRVQVENRWSGTTESSHRTCSEGDVAAALPFQLYLVDSLYRLQLPFFVHIKRKLKHRPLESVDFEICQSPRPAIFLQYFVLRTCSSPNLFQSD